MTIEERQIQGGLHDQADTVRAVDGPIPPPVTVESLWWDRTSEWERR